MGGGGRFRLVHDSCSAKCARLWSNVLRGAHPSPPGSASAYDVITPM